MWAPPGAFGSIPNFAGFVGPGAFNEPSPERLDRQIRIEPCIQAIRSGVIPDLDRNHLMELIKDFKKEGNDLFKEKSYLLAGEHYTCAMYLAKILETGYLVEVDREILSTLFTNRAACFNKLDNFPTAVEDCDFAIRFNKKNIKAYYRKAVALKSLKKYHEALAVATAGRNITGAIPAEIHEFNELLKEIQSHLPEQARVVPQQLNAGHRPQAVPTQVQSVTVSTTVSASTAQAKGEKKEKDMHVDMSWLEGTNANVSVKAKTTPPPNKQKKEKTRVKKATQVPAAKQQMKYTGKYSALLTEDQSDDEDDQSEDDVSDLDNKAAVSDITMSSSNTATPAIITTSTHSTNAISWADMSHHLSEDGGFAVLGGARPKTKTEAGLQHSSSYKGSTGFDGSQTIQPGQPVQKVTVASATGSKSFVPITSRTPLPYPFSTEYDFTFACPSCFVEPEGRPTVKALYPDLPHHCTKELFIVHPKMASGEHWYNVRSRPKTNFTGEYRLCNDFLRGQPCKVGRQLCHFCHNAAEQHLWTLDRNGQFEMGRFVNEWHAIAVAIANQQYPAQCSQQNVDWQSPGHPKAQNIAQNGITKQGANQVDCIKQVVQEINGTKQIVQRYIFPLKDSHRFRLACKKCLELMDNEGHYNLKQFNHTCAEDMLIVQPKGSNSWTHVRERINPRNVGKYIRCRFFGSTVPCRSQDMCMYAHSGEEQFLWNLEKDGHFNITEFILQNRSPKTKRCFTVEDVFRKYPGWFQFLCRACFYAQPCRISVQDKGNPNLCSHLSHQWSDNMLLIHVNLQQSITAIAERPFKHKGAFYLFCHKMQFCVRQAQTKCNFAHSMVERDIWLIERDYEISRTEIVQRSQLFLLTLNQTQTSPVPTSPIQTDGQNKSQLTAAVSSSVTELKQEEVQCPFRVMEVCNLCWKMGRKIQKDKARQDRCAGSGMGHMWSQNRAYLITPENKLLRPLPKRIPTGCRWIICKHIQEKGKCDYSLGGYCQFAHNKTEMDVWTWMVKNNVRTLEELCRLSEQAQKASSSTTKVIPKGQTVVWAKPVTDSQQTNKASPFQLNVNSLYCHYCSVQCNGQKQWDSHCASEKHLFNVNSDKEHQWNYRQPPWGVVAGNYELCKLHLEKKCRYSDKPDMYNFCKCAHSQEELDEWRERWEWRQMKRSIAHKEQMFSYMEELLEEYQMEQASINVISEDIADVKIECASELFIYKEDKNSTHTWTFVITTKPNKPLKRVALLHNHDRLHFSLVTEDSGQMTQIAQADTFLVGQNPYEYNIPVIFTGGIFGSFMQWVVFDFGEKPVLVRKLGVELGTKFIHDKVKRLRQQMKFDRWTGENRHIVEYTESTAESQDPFEECMLKKYKPPASADMVITQHSVGTGLNRHNYVHKMHRLLEIEEIKRAQIIASYSHEAEVELHSFIEEEGALISCRSGELFAKVPLNEQLSEDTNAGKLILTSVKSVLLAPAGFTDKKVYEAVMVTKENFDYDGRGRDYIYVCLSPRCVHDLELVGGDYLNIQMQFQMDRLPFCRMHFAIDQLENTDIVFPDVSRIGANWNQTRVYRISSQVLNADQLNIVEHILAERTTYSPPIVVYGPFGTGKTETLAQAAMLLVKKNFESRVLICTHSNSAADLYILKHFDSFVKNNPDISVVRVYSRERRLSTVPMQVRKYCLLSKDKQTIVLPLREDILSHHIVITTLSTSLSLSRIRDLKGFFSHIFIDEAAQALECEAIMPLSLVTDTTCVVLAGDHMQLSPKIYSQEAKLQMFHKSLLERLYQHYDNYHRSANGTSPLNILLSINYRTKMEILRFISAIFYGSPDRLHEASGLPDATGVIPLTFYTAYGKEVQDPDSTTYYNMAEVEEVVSRVIELYENWPPEWGERRPESIGVVSPYTEQVNRIRVHLRKKRLSGVIVERVMNIQGREFRAIFVSTVRTIHLVDKPPEITKAMTECDGEVGDFGFLSDNKLLNTALTRAQSFVGVIGDPMALCAIGECALTWRAYLKHCQQLKSIQPETVTLQSIRTEVESLMKSPKGQNLEMLNHLSELIKERKQAVQITEPQHLVQASSSKVSDQSLANDSNNQPESADLAINMSEDWSSGHEVKTDDIIKQLAVDALKVCQLELEKSRSAAAVVSGNQNGEPLIDCVKVKEDNGHAILLYKPTRKKDPEKRQLLSADDYDDEFDSDEDLDRNDANMQSTYVDFTHQQLLDMISKQPELYRQCILHIENSSCMYATEKDASSDIKEIKISSRSRCGHAFHGDEVVVELLHIDEEDIKILDDASVKQGKVVGILKRMINPRYRMFVCMVEEGNTGLMVPLNHGIPKIYNLETKNHLKKTSRGHVCIYKFTRDHQIQFDHYEPVDNSNPMSKLFIVRYLKWDPKSYLPLGIVVGVLPAGTDIESGMKILDIEYCIPKKFRTETENEVTRKFSKFTIPSSEFGRRMDFRDRLTFTIDPEGSEDLDDALSIETLPNGQYRIGIHIADVSAFVKKDSAIDKEARSRATSYYPVGGKPTPMLPEKLSTDLCSLKPKQDRLTLSLFIIITASAQIIDTQLRRCIINSSYQLNYEEVEDILDRIDINQQVTEDLKLALFHLHKISQRWRKQRLGNQGLYMDLDPEAGAAPKAHLLVKELMIQANHHIALLLMQHCKGSVPLRTQMPPNELALDEWRQKSAEVAKNTVILTKPYLSRGNVCLCTNQCHCIKINQDEEHDVCILSDAWEQLKSVLVEEDEYSPENLVTLAANPDNCPETKLAILQYHRLQKPSLYVCSGSLPEDLQLHYDMNVMCYTHFTSPIRRYMDLVIHRLLESVLTGKSSPYSEEELNDLCNHCSDAAQRSRRYERATDLLQLSRLIQSSPATLHCVVETVDEAHLMLRVLHLKSAVPSLGRVAMSLLGLSERPCVTEDSIMVKWEERIYDLDVDPNNVVDSKQEAMLNPYRFVVRIPADDWRRLLFAMIQGNSQSMLLSLLAANEKLKSTVSDRYVEDVTCEVQHIPGNKLFCRYSLEIQPASVMKVQLNGNMFRGLLAPRMQLLELTDALNICLEHRSDPSLCFASNTTLQASKPQYRDEESYKSAWLRLLAIESAHEAINSGDTVTIRGVFISWNKTGAAVIGTVMLPLKFCEDREIIFSSQVTSSDLDHSNMQPLDYFCIRYSNISPPDPDPDCPTEKFDIDFEQPFTWVGHCLSVDCERSKARGRILLTLRLHQHSVPMPEVLLLNNTELKATVELIPKSSSSRNQEKAINDICDATPLARSIALGQRLPELDYAHQEALKEYRFKQVPHLPEPNHSQQFAISNALAQSFSLIQGPPGTGKTVTGVRIAYLLCQFNRTQPAEKGIQPQLLYCGPSNKSVDVVTAYLLKLGKACPRLVRIYSETIEQEEFPLPGDVGFRKHHRQQAYTISEDIKHVSLHHMIRDKSQCSQAMTILDFDERIRRYKAGDKSIEPVDPEMYAEVMLSAVREVLRSCQIVLSTCNGSASQRVKCETNIRQLIIDESGMSTEPESILPIIVSQAQQVILIGDHKQLQPIVLNKQAKDLGLSKSLFERYANRAYMLTQQYRMHEAIAEFPSQHFYEGRLECGSDEQTKPSQLKFWPNGRGKPFCFVHIMGREGTLTVTTTDGSEQSKTNLEEVTQAVRAASLLVRRFHVNPQEVVVLSQYRAQCAEIQKALLHRGEKDINVSTVVSAQGSEWDYVILSTVRSLPKFEIEPHPTNGWRQRKLGFITDHHQINVAITRARKGLIIIGNKHLLGCDDMWKNLLIHYEKNHKVIDASEFMT